MNNENDRKLLVLLSYIEKYTPKQKRLLHKLDKIYTDNAAYTDKIRDELVSLGYLNLYKGTQSDSGQYLRSNYSYEITPTGIGAIFSGRFPSERAARLIEKRNLFIGWAATVVGVAGGILGVLSALGLL